ncbi:hypothetical protein, partial [Streptomyces sp. IBSBF 3010]|uniref:hypothetical protein n=1 Tax=Streptomyces sp. IBSBF 3010 TaxID=2903526 RepID=UPI002FDBE26B
MGRGRVHLPLHHRHGRTTRARHRRLPIQSRTYNGTGRRTGRRGCVRLTLHHRQFGPGRNSGGVRLTPD